MTSAPHRAAYSASRPTKAASISLSIVFAIVVCDECKSSPLDHAGCRPHQRSMPVQAHWRGRVGVTPPSPDDCRSNTLFYDPMFGCTPPTTAAPLSRLITSGYPQNLDTARSVADPYGLLLSWYPRARQCLRLAPVSVRPFHLGIQLSKFTASHLRLGALRLSEHLTPSFEACQLLS